MKWHRILAVIYRHCYESRRNLNRVTETLFWPIQNVLLWGFFTVYLTRHNGLSPGLGNDLLGAAILWGMFNAFQRDLATGFMEELWSRNLLNLFSTPLSISEYMTGLIMLNFLKAMVGLLFASLIAFFCYAYNILPSLPAFLPFLFNLMLFSLSIGLIITGSMIRYSANISTLAWSFAGLLMPISCVFYPVSTLPAWLRPLAMSLPTTHSFEAMRQLILHGQFSYAHFFWGLLLDLAYLIVAVIFFRQMFASARSRGFLAKQL